MHDKDQQKILRDILSDTASTEAEKAEARRALNGADTGAAAELPAANRTPNITGLRAELLQKTDQLELAEVAYGDVHEFCRERGWSSDAIKLFEQWRSEFFKTAPGRSKRQELEIFWRMYNYERQPVVPWLADPIMAETRRRLGTSAGFRKLFDGNPELLLEVLRGCTRWVEDGDVRKADEVPQ